MEDIDSLMVENYRLMEEIILDLSSKVKDGKQLLIGLAGPPGAGKSTTSARLTELIPGSIILPMDGYHLTKQQLSQFKNPKEAFSRRGAHWTFDGERFLRDIQVLRSTGEGKFPSFDHGVGDPVENDIHISKENKIIFVEGNYLLLPIEPWVHIKEYLDYCFFISCEESIIYDRVYKRHMGTGNTEELAKHRVETNDIINAREILLSQTRADKVINSM